MSLAQVRVHRPYADTLHRGFATTLTLTLHSPGGDALPPAPLDHYLVPVPVSALVCASTEISCLGPADIIVHVTAILISHRPFCALSRNLPPSSLYAS